MSADDIFLSRMERDSNVARKFFDCESDDWNQTMLLKYPQMEQWRREKTCISYWCRVGRLECLSCYNRKSQVKQEVKQNTCSWCRNGCKNKKVYTSHSLKDNSGVITCPKLLKTICRNCGKTGHAMGKFCPEPSKPKHLLLPAKCSFYIDRNDPEYGYTSGDSDYFPLSSDDEDDVKGPSRIMVGPSRIRIMVGPQVSREKEKEEDKPINTWASKLFPKKI